MERRFVIFLALTVLLWGGYLTASFFLAPPPPEPVAEQPAENPAEQPPKAKPEEPDEPPVKPETLPTETSKPPAPTVPRVKVALGSADPKGPHRMLVTIDSRGAAVERVELNRYQSVEEFQKDGKILPGHSGYLAQLALSDADDGAMVNIVGPGTPAALATPDAPSAGIGLQIGDVITAFDGQQMADASRAENWLMRETKPDQTIKITVERKGSAQPLTYTSKLVRRPMEVVAPESHTYETPEGGLAILPQDPLSLVMTLESIGSKAVKPGGQEIAGLPSLLTGNWSLDAKGDDFAQFSFALDDAALAGIGKSGGLKIVKRYTLAKAAAEDDPAYHLDLKVTLENTGSDTQMVAYRLLGPTGLPLEGWWYSTKLHPEMFKGAGARDVAFKVAGGSHQLRGCPLIVDEAKDAIERDEPPLLRLLDGDNAEALDYAGVDAQFFAAALMPQTAAGQQPIKFRRVEALCVQDPMTVPKARLRTTDVSFQVVSEVLKLEPRQPASHEFKVFFGPKDPKVLDDYQLGALIEYGWPVFRIPALMLLYVLQFLQSIAQNYGIAIILLTVIVRSCMIPLSLKQARSAAMMQQLAPEMQKVKDKFPDDPMKQHAAVQELYKKHNFNPFGGCLLVFIQLPIFIGLYRCLSVDIDLRDAALIPGLAWASNLAGPDKLFYWKDYVWGFIGDEANGWLGPYFNVFPLITVSLFLLQQKMFMPPATDEQTKMQQQMMMYMTVFMGVMFYKVPAGLCLYFITSSLWGIAERKMLGTLKKKDAGTESEKSVVPSKSTSPNGSAAKSSLAKKQKKR